MIAVVSPMPENGIKKPSREIDGIVYTTLVTPMTKGAARRCPLI